MIARQGRFVEYSVFGKETSVDWTIISDAKGQWVDCEYCNIVRIIIVIVYPGFMFNVDSPQS